MTVMENHSTVPPAGRDQTKRRRAAPLLLVGLLGILLAGGAPLAWRAHTRRVNSLGMVLRRIPAGVLTMGSTLAERTWALEQGAQPKWVALELAPQIVPIAQAFWMGATEVTIGQFRAFVEATGYVSVAEQRDGPLTWDMSERAWRLQVDRSWKHPGFAHDEGHPAVCLNWQDARAFCRWLTQTEQAAGLIGTNTYYRLPTEAEWEWAARGPRARRFAWGDDPARALQYANILDQAPLPDGSHWDTPAMPWFDGHAFTAPVACFAPTRHGLFDLHGNAWEWCIRHQRLQPRQAGRRTKYAAYDFMLRGGAWDNQAGNARAATRRPAPPHFASDTTGFRVVLVQDPPGTP